MTSFEKDKAAKLKRILSLRIMNAIGMIAWREDRYGCAEQKIRILHPISWPWIIAFIVAVVMHGVIEVWKEIKRLPEDIVWW